MRDDFRIIPVTLAILLHALVLAMMIFAFDFSDDERPATPLAVNATLVTENQVPTTTEPPPPEPEPQPEEPEPEPEPDTSEQERQALEQQKRQEDLQAEQERIRLEQEAERERQQQAEEERRRREQAEKERQQREAEERREREEAQKERERQEAERRRQEEVERQRLENERRKREAERQARLQAELDEEERRLNAMQSGDMARYIFAIQQKIQRNWVRPASARAGIECVAIVRQLPGGEVVGVRIESCNGDDAVRRSIEAAIMKASPLPEPANPVLFDRNLRITVKPEQ